MWVKNKVPFNYQRCLSLSGAAFLVIMDTTIVNVAIPVIDGHFGISEQQGLWMLASYSIFHAISMLLTGKITSVIGEVNTFKRCLLLFIFASLGAGLSVNYIMLVFFRVLQGIAAGPVIPISQSLLLRRTSTEQRSELLSIWSGFVISAPLLGPIIGGYICGNVKWVWLFLINIPVGVLIYCGVMSDDSERIRCDTSFNLIGFLLLTVSTLLVQVIVGCFAYIDTSTIFFKVMLFLCVYITVLAIVWDGYSESNVLNWSLLKNRNFLIGVMFWFFSYIVNFGSLLPLIMSTQFNYTPLMVGVVSSPSAIAPLFLSKAVGDACKRANPVVLLTLGFILYFIIFHLRSEYLQEETSFIFFAVTSFGEGFASLFFYIPLTLITFSGVSNENVRSAATLSGFLRGQISTMGTTITYYMWNQRNLFHVYRLNELVSDNKLDYQTYTSNLLNVGFKNNEIISQIKGVIEHCARIMALDDLFFLNSYMYIFMVILLIIVSIFVLKD